jgi:hypothetical protein
MLNNWLRLRKVLFLCWCTHLWATPIAPIIGSLSVPAISGVQGIAGRHGLRLRQMLRGGFEAGTDIPPVPSSDQTLAQLASSEEEEAKLLGLLRTCRKEVSLPMDGEDAPAESTDLELVSARQHLQKELPLLFKRPSNELREFSYLPEVFRYLTRSNNHDSKIRVSTSQFSLNVESKRLFTKFGLMDLPSLFPSEIQDSTVLAS